MTTEVELFSGLTKIFGGGATGALLSSAATYYVMKKLSGKEDDKPDPVEALLKQHMIDTARATESIDNALKAFHEGMKEITTEQRTGNQYLAEMKGSLDRINGHGR